MDPLVRRHLAVVETVPAALSFFADDLSSAMMDVVRRMSCLLPELRALKPAAGLQLSLRKTKVVNFGGMPDDRLAHILRMGFRMEAVQVVRQATSLGFVIGPDSAPLRWGTAHEKHLSRCAHVRSVSVHFRDCLRAYRSLLFSVLSFRLQLAVRSEAASISSVPATPMYAVRPVMASGLGAFGCDFAPPELSATARAAQMCIAITHPRLSMHLERIRTAIDTDEALLLWRRPPWLEGCGVEILRGALDQVNKLPAGLDERRSLQRALYTHLFAAFDTRALHRRLRCFAAEATSDDAIVVCFKPSLGLPLVALQRGQIISALRTKSTDG